MVAVRPKRLDDRTEASRRPGDSPHTTGFHAQQAVEKALKALLIQAHVRFPFTHDLVQLFELNQEQGCGLPLAANQLEELSPYAGHRRYPGWIHQPGPAEIQRLVAVAEQVVAWAEAVINPPPAAPAQASDSD